MFGAELNAPVMGSGREERDGRREGVSRMKRRRQIRRDKPRRKTRGRGSEGEWNGRGAQVYIPRVETTYYLMKECLRQDEKNTFN